MGRKNGFTLIEMVVVLVVVSILAAILFPTISKHIKEAKITRTVNEGQVITAAIMMLYADTGKWPNTTSNLNASPLTHVDRLLTGRSTDPVVTGIIGDGSVNWGGGTFTITKQLRDFLFYNNPDDDQGAVNESQAGQDYPSTGEYKWNGPYIDTEFYLDPWGNQYVISARYFPGNTSHSFAGHRVLVLSAGDNGLWDTPLSNAVTRRTAITDEPREGDIGTVVMVNE